MFEKVPSKEDYKKYTGNAGPSLEYWYYRGVVVFWSRGAINMRIMESAGLPFMLSYISSAIPSDVSKINNHITSLLTKGRATLNSDILEGMLQGKNEVSIIKALASCKCLPNEAFANLLARVIKTMKSEKVFKQALLIVENTLLPNHCYSEDSLSVVLAFLDSLELRKLVSTFKVARETVVFKAMKNSVDIMKSNKVEKLAGVAYIAGNETFQAFHDSVAMMGGSFEKLKSILDHLFTLSDDTAKYPLVINLANIRAKQLSLDTMNGVPRLSWKQPDANFCGSQNTEVTAFLCSPEQSHTFYNFDGIRHARNWASKYFRSSVQNGYSAKADAGGRGKGAYVKLTKTKAVHEEMDLLYMSKKNELVELTKIISDALGVRITAESKRSQSSSNGPQAKKLRDKDIIVIE